MTLSSKRFKNLLSIRTRRGEIKRPLSESAVDTFFVFSRHLMKNVFLSKWHFLQRDSRIYYRFEPEGGKSSALYQNPLSTHFSCFLDILWKTFFYQNDIVCMQIQEFTIVSNPKGDKKAPSIRICVRHVFHVFSTSYEPGTPYSQQVRQESPDD